MGKGQVDLVCVINPSEVEKKYERRELLGVLYFVHVMGLAISFFCPRVKCMA